VLVTWYGYNDNSGTTENSYGSSAIAYAAPQSVNTTDVAGNSVTHPNAGNIKHTVATEGTGTYDDPITAASSADEDPACYSASNPVHQFLSQGGATLSPGTIMYNPEVQKYFILEDSCIECGDEYACKITTCTGALSSCSDTDDGKVPSGCVADSLLHIDFWMGPSSASDGTYADDLGNCEDNATGGDGSNKMQWDQAGRWPIVVNPPPNLPVAPGPIFSSTGSCFTSSQVSSVSCP
jgi:hypothetical protein